MVPVSGWVNTLATFVQLAASACNPFIYGIFRSEFRKAFKAQYMKVLHQMGCWSYSLHKSSTNNNSSLSSNKASILKMKRTSNGRKSWNSSANNSKEWQLARSESEQLTEPVG